MPQYLCNEQRESEMIQQQESQQQQLNCNSNLTPEVSSVISIHQNIFQTRNSPNQSKTSQLNPLSPQHQFSTNEVSTFRTKAEKFMKRPSNNTSIDFKEFKQHRQLREHINILSCDLKNQPFSNFISFNRSPQLNNLSSHKGSTLLPNLNTQNTVGAFSKVQIDPRIKEKTTRLHLDQHLNNSSMLTPTQPLGIHKHQTYYDKFNNFLN